MNAPTVKLPAHRRRLLYAIAAMLWASGALWLAAHYLLTKQGEYGPETSPIEPLSLKVHGACAMAALWVFGLLWGVHIVRGWQSRRGRWTGGLMFAATALMIATGWLLYYLGDEDFRAVASVIHWAIGLAALPLFLWHRFGRKRVGRSGGSAV